MQRKRPSLQVFRASLLFILGFVLFAVPVHALPLQGEVKNFELLAQPKKMRGRSAPLKELGAFPDTQEAVQVHSGKYGTYLKVGSKNISLADDMKVEDLTLELVIPLIRDKLGSAKKAGPSKGKNQKAKKPAAKVKAAVKAPAKVPVKAPAKVPVKASVKVKTVKSGKVVKSAPA